MCKQTFSGHESDINAITVSSAVAVMVLLLDTDLHGGLQKMSAATESLIMYRKLANQIRFLSFKNYNVITWYNCLFIT